jgi:hypothetical protein
MLQPKPMKAGDFTCLLCGSKLELKIEDLRIGENTGQCPMCSEPYCVKITEKEMEELIEAEEGC